MKMPFFHKIHCLLFLAFAIGSRANPAPEQSSERALSPFGVSTSASSLNNYATWGPIISSGGVQCLRGFDVFANIEPAENAWNWKNVDAELDAASRSSMEISGIFFYGAPWIPASSGFPTGNLEAWSKYVSAVVRHVDGKVKYWEVWNEPPNFTNNAGTPEDYANLVKASHKAAHAADPSCHIGLAAQSNDVNWLDRTIAAGARGNFDYITVHPYEILGTVGNGWEAEYMSIVPTLRKMLTARDPERANVPIWFTEVGEALGQKNGSITVTETIQAQDLIKAYIMGLAQGAASIDWFEVRDGDSGAMGLFDASGKSRPAWSALSEMIRQLGPHPVYVGWTLLNKKDYSFVFKGAGGFVMAAWTPPGQTDKIDFGPSVEKIDPIVGKNSKGAISLTNSPVFIAPAPTELVNIARSNRAKPFPWDGDYTKAAAVFINMGTPHAEHGLHQLYADTTSTSVTINNEMARDCSKAASQTFTVDPNFLSYNAEPIRITVVARKINGGPDAGFNLKYESTSGWKSLGKWIAISNNLRWETLECTITDSQFIGKWGYNFSLDSDSTEHSGYYLKSVTVTKL